LVLKISLILAGLLKISSERTQALSENNPLLFDFETFGKILRQRAQKSSIHSFFKLKFSTNFQVATL